MNSQDWTPEAIQYARTHHKRYGRVGLGIAPIFMAIVAAIMLWRYRKTRNRKLPLFMPLATLGAFLTSTVLSVVAKYTTVQVSVLGYETGFSALIPPTCEAAAQVVCPYNLPYDLQEFRGFVRTVATTGRWDRLAIPRILGIVTFFSGFAVILLGVGWAFALKWEVEEAICETCGTHVYVHPANWDIRRPCMCNGVEYLLDGREDSPVWTECVRRVREMRRQRRANQQSQAGGVEKA